MVSFTTTGRSIKKSEAGVFTPFYIISWVWCQNQHVRLGVQTSTAKVHLNDHIREHDPDRPHLIIAGVPIERAALAGEYCTSDNTTKAYTEQPDERSSHEPTKAGLDSLPISAAARFFLFPSPSLHKTPPLSKDIHSSHLHNIRLARYKVKHLSHLDNSFKLQATSSTYHKKYC